MYIWAGLFATSRCCRNCWQTTMRFGRGASCRWASLDLAAGTIACLSSSSLGNGLRTQICRTCMDACQDAGSSMSEPVLLSTLIPPVQAAAGFCYLCIGLIALCLTLVAHFVDTCIAMVLPGRAECQLVGAQQEAAEQERDEPHSAALSLCYGPARRVLRSGHGMAGACCGICVGLYRACVDTPSRKCSSECNQNEHHATEQTRNSELQDL